jgi:lipopolysaccharide transport system ATP-binding protein
MSEIAVRVENVSKRYRIGMKNEMHDSFVGAMVDFVKRPLTNLKRLRKLSSFDQHSDDCDDIIWALRDVSFEVKRGEVVGIIGNNGSGKSTLLKIISRVTEPTKGRGETNGRVGSLLEVGTGFHPELTGRENIYLNGTVLGMKKVEITHKFDAIVDFSGVEKFIDTPVKRYSSGMYVRLAFAVAAHLEPEILLVDEVLAVGDAAFQKKCLGKMGDVAKDGRTVLFVSHNMAAIAAICSRAILIQTGSVVADGNAYEIVAHYQQSLGSKQTSFVGLTDWPSRHGPGDLARLKSVATYDLKGQSCDVIPIGQGLVIRVHIHFFKPVRTPEVGVAILNLLGQRVSHIVSAWEGLFERVDVGEYMYEITIPRLFLVPGLYTLTLWVKREGRRGGWPQDDAIEAALNFQVTPAVINGRAPYFDVYCQPGEVYIDSQWSVERV